MANFSISPGVTLNEIDNTFLLGQPVQAGAAIIGPTTKGPVEQPTLVTSYSDYTSIFGDTLLSSSNSYSYLTSIAAYSYFNYGGESLLVTRVTSGSYTPATSSIGSSAESGAISTDVDALLTSLASVTGSAGTYTITGSSGAGTGFTASITLSNGNTVSSITATNGGSGYVIGDVITITSSSLGYNTPTMGTNATITLDADDIVNSTAFTLETISKGITMNNGTSGTGGALSLGSKDNVRFEVTNPSTSSGLFNVLVRQGNDITSKKIVLETWNKVNLDPESDRYIAKVIGDQTITYDSINEQNVTTGDYPNNSRYIRVSSVNLKTPNYLDANGTAKSEFTSSIPSTTDGLFNGATGTIAGGANFYDNINSTNTQGLQATDYDIAIKLMNNKDTYRYNVLFTPGLINSIHTSQVTSIITNTISRGDALYVPDLTEYSGTLNDAIGQAVSRDTSYAATYWPWVKMLDPGTGKQVWLPASTVVPGVYAYNDKVAAPWFAPAGINRGGLNTVSYAKFKLTQAQKDNLYEANINPLATLSGEGVVVFGQKTLQKESSALDRVNVRRLLIELKSYIGQLADQIVFEQNTAVTRNGFISRVTPYLEAIQQKQGLYAFKVLMDDSNNTPAVIDRNQLVGQIYIQPTRTAEFISLDFILMPTGAEFPG
jgi:phage tail sheath protein FI